ncbi:hypothetical protein GALMADRAFT_246361 [Galerina marginata CBS 339.88]|uniref:3'-5' exonuclease domain-containing protein n=1 Tax=Galerina marginata (strain CBS 339.88) TaxID=685588 RepID=A0A067T1R7_GALM3|nr:hypothetical protein GALMADRAFT_246361 [Galerina marginata CBS 339.88]
MAFSHKDDDGRSLKDILQSDNTKKIFYDVRNDADALFNLYAIELENTYDLQLLKVAARRSSKIRVRFVSGLGKTIDTYLCPPSEWKRIKDAGALLFAPEKGGSYEVFESRPLDERIQAYAAQDVALLFDLQLVLESRLGFADEDWKRRILSASASRVAEAHSQFYSGHGQHRAVAPSF